MHFKVDPFAAQFVQAEQGDFIKDLSLKKRTLGYVTLVDKEVNTMYVQFPKMGTIDWVDWINRGHYKVIK